MITIHNKQIDFIQFPSGESHLRGKDSLKDLVPNSHIIVELKFQSNDDIINMMLLDNVLFNDNILYTLNMPYIPSSRQDRCEQSLEAETLKIYMDIFNNLKACMQIIVLDPHSNESIKHIKQFLKVKEITDTEMFKTYIMETKPYTNIVVVAPDLGAIDRANLVVAQLQRIFVSKPIQLLTAEKTRDYATGLINGIDLINPEQIAVTDTTQFLVVDDICDGGRTFIELIGKMKEAYGDISADLMVSHGFFTKGLDVLHKMGYSKVYYANDMRRI